MTVARCSCFAALAAFLWLACTGEVEGPAGPTAEDPPDQPREPVGECRTPTQTLFFDLAPTCEGCHGSGSAFPAFQSLESFELLVAYEPRLVVPGDPDRSRLVALLEGRADGTFAQMPLGDRTFAELEAAGVARTSIANVAEWIRNLGPCEVPVDRSDVPLTRRLSAAQIRASLYVQLGLTPADVPLSTQVFPLRAPGDFLTEPYDPGGGMRNWASIGGSNLLEGSPASRSVDPTFVATLGPLSQAWCRRAIEKPGNDALFRHATRTSTSATDAPAIRENIRYLQLRMLGIEATDDDVERLYTGVYLPYEARADGGPLVAWTAVCSALIRHPLWLSE